MPRSKQFVWKSRAYLMKQLIETALPRLPLLVKITQGYMGYNEALHTFSSDEVYFITGMKTQRRVVMSNTNGKYLSVPIDYKDKFQRVINGTAQPPQKLEHIVAAWQANNGTPMRVMLEGDKNIKFCAGLSVETTDSLGTWKLQDVYDERYLIAHAVLGGKPCEKPTVIPAYISLRFVEVLGLSGGTQDDLKQTLNSLHTQIQSFKYPDTAIEGNKDVMIYEDDFNTKEYDYVIPKKFLRETSNKTTYSPKSNLNGAYLSMDKKSPPFSPAKEKVPGGMTFDYKRNVKKPSPPVEKSYNSLTKDIDDDDQPIYEEIGDFEIYENADVMESGNTKEVIQKGLNVKDHIKFIEKTYTNVPTPPDESVSQNASLKSQEKQITKESAAKCSKNTSTVTPNQNSSKDKSKQQTKDKNTMPKEEKSSKFSTFFKRGKASLSEPGSTKSKQATDVKPTAQRSMSIPSGGTVSKTRGRSNSTPYDSIQMSDISRLGCKEVSGILKHLKLDKYSQGFQENDIDGELLLSLNENDLIQQFDFTSFEAKKLVNFAKNDWRPKF